MYSALVDCLRRCFSAMVISFYSELMIPTSYLVMFDPQFLDLKKVKNFVVFSLQIKLPKKLKIKESY